MMKLWANADFNGRVGEKSIGGGSKEGKGGVAFRTETVLIVKTLAGHDIDFRLNFLNFNEETIMDASHSLKIENTPVTLRELALAKVRQAIISGYFKAGDRLVERSLCDELGVSRTVVR